MRPVKSAAKRAGLVSGAKLRAIADGIERAALREVAELRRLADLMDGVARVTRVTAKPRKPLATARQIEELLPTRARGKASKPRPARAKASRKAKTAPKARGR